MPLISLLLALLTAPSVSANPDAASGVAWMAFEDAVERVRSDRAAGIESRMIFVEIYATWCPYCKRLDTTTMTDPAVIEALNKDFYPVRFDGEQTAAVTFREQTFRFVPYGDRGYHELAVGLAGGQLSYPTLVFLNQDLQVVQPLQGYRPPEELLPILAFFGEGHYVDTPWEKFLEAYQARTETVSAP